MLSEAQAMVRDWVEDTCTYNSQRWILYVPNYCHETKGVSSESSVCWYLLYLSQPFKPLWWATLGPKEWQVANQHIPSKSIQIHYGRECWVISSGFHWFDMFALGPFNRQSFSLCPQLVHGQIQIWGYRSWIILILAPESVHGFGLKVSLDEFDAVKIHTWQDWQEHIFENKET